MKIDLQPELEEVLEAAVRSGGFNSREDVLAEAIRLLRGSQDANGASPADEWEADDWIEKFHEWSRKPRVGNAQLDDGRDAIYEGRGE